MSSFGLGMCPPDKNVAIGVPEALSMLSFSLALSSALLSVSRWRRVTSSTWLSYLFFYAIVLPGRKSGFWAGFSAIS